jgi:hypothetical protein
MAGRVWSCVLPVMGGCMPAGRNISVDVGVIGLAVAMHSHLGLSTDEKLRREEGRPSACATAR